MTDIKLTQWGLTHWCLTHSWISRILIIHLRLSHCILISRLHIWINKSTRWLHWRRIKCILLELRRSSISSTWRLEWWLLISWWWHGWCSIRLRLRNRCFSIISSTWQSWFRWCKLLRLTISIAIIIEMLNSSLNNNIITIRIISITLVFCHHNTTHNAKSKQNYSQNKGGKPASTISSISV